MLAFRAAEMAAFRQARRAAFEEEMAAHARDFAPRLAASLSEADLRVAIQRTIARAESHALHARGPVRLYLDLTLQLGFGLDIDPRYPWMTSILHGDDLADEMGRADALHEAFSGHLDRIAGPDGAWAQGALERIAPFELPSSIADVNAYLEWLYPEACAAAGGPALQSLVANALSRAREVHGLSEPRSQIPLAVLAFALGGEVDRDPFYPWVERTLTARAAPEARAERLARQASLWFTAALRDEPPKAFDAQA